MEIKMCRNVNNYNLMFLAVRKNMGYSKFVGEISAKEDNAHCHNNFKSDASNKGGTR
jgi:hypothetical protein